MDEPEDPALRRLIDVAAVTYGRALEADLTSHPTPEALVEYQERRLGGPQSDSIRAHLVACRSCAEELQRLDSFDLESERLAAGADTAAAHSWSTFRRGVADDEQPAPREVAATSRRMPRARRPTWSLAAGIGLALLGITFFVAGPRDDGPGKSTPPATHPFVFDLLPDGTATRRDMTGLEVVEVPAGMDPLVPRLLLGDQAPHDSYVAVLNRASGETVWRQDGLKRQPAGEFALLIPRTVVSPGDYVVLLDGRDGGIARRLASYTLRLTYAE